jgi:AcrR family transcriptional regulator
MTGKDGSVPPSAPLSRELIVAAARASIEADGVDRLSLRAVARQLGVTAPALYAYVTDKDDLLAAVASQYFDELADRVEAIEARDPLDGIRALSRAYVDHALASPHLFRLLFRFPPAATGMEVPGVEVFAPATRVFELALVTTNEAIDAGLLAVTDAVSASLTMWAAVHGACEVLLMGFGLDDAAADALVESVISTMLAGQVHGS